MSTEIDSEHAWEVKITDDSMPFRTTFGRHFLPIERIHRQLPIGLFESPVSRTSHWTPGGKSQIDLWARSSDQKTFHLFELKAAANKKVGIIPESLYYARLLHYIMGRLKDGPEIIGSGKGIDDVRNAEQIVAWLAAPEYHPLVYSRGNSPLEWINEGLRSDDTVFRILPIDTDNKGPRDWKIDQTWPRIKR